MPTDKPAALYRFSIFEVNPATGELFRQGMRVRLQEQQFRLLTLLLERPGELISRDEVRTRLWPSDTYVEFDNSLNVAVRKLRDALRDEADSPRFIETVPRRGYRFLAEVSTVDAKIPAADAAVAAVTGPTGKPRYRTLALSAVICFAAALFLVALWLRGNISGPVLASSDHVVIAGFENRTGDPQFDGTLLPAFRVKLEESPYLSLLPQSSLLAAVKASGKTNLDHISLADMRKACTAAGANALLRGEVASVGSGYQVRTEAQGCSDGKKLAMQEARAATPSGVLQALGEATVKLRRQLGEPSASVASFNAPVAQATTGSLAALKAFSIGEEKRAQGQDYETIPYYKMAVDLDPQFALAYGRLGVIYSNAEEFELGKKNYQKAFDLRERTTERERLYLATHYYTTVTGELEKATQAYEIWRQLYPNDLVPANNLSDSLLVQGDPEAAIASAKDALRINPRNGFPYMSLIQANMRSGHLAAAKDTYQQAVANKLDGVLAHVLRFDIAFAEDDAAEMQRQREWAHSNPREGEMLDADGTAAFARGKARQARAIFDNALEIALKNNLKEYAALVTLDKAEYEAELGLLQPGRKDALAALQLVPDSADVQIWAAIVLARSGDLERSQVLADRVEKAAPLDTLVQRMELPAQRAIVRMAKKDAEGALRELETAQPYDLSRATALMNIYLRALAYLQAGHAQQAANEFQKLLDHRDVQPNSPYVSLAQLGLARAHRAIGAPSARADYETFLSSWKDADPDLVPFRKARQELAEVAPLP